MRHAAFVTACDIIEPPYLLSLRLPPTSNTQQMNSIETAIDVLRG